jgi:hypothetical protein
MCYWAHRLLSVVSADDVLLSTPTAVITAQTVSDCPCTVLSLQHSVGLSLYSAVITAQCRTVCTVLSLQHSVGLSLYSAVITAQCRTVFVQCCHYSTNSVGLSVYSAVITAQCRTVCTVLSLQHSVGLSVYSAVKNDLFKENTQTIINYCEMINLLWCGLSVQFRC